jgi:DNA-binding transcriptional LysR family regulator
MDTLRDAEVLVAVADAGSISAAARKRGMSQPALSRSVGRIEARLGVTLIDRGTRAMRLTHAGQTFVEGARRLLRDAHALEATTSSLGRRLGGGLRVSVPPALGRARLLAPILEWHRGHRAVVLELWLEPRRVDLAADSVDLAVRLGPLPDSTLVGRKLGSYAHLLVASPSYLATHGTPKHPSELAAHALLTLQIDGPNTRWPLTRGRTRSVVEVRPRLVTNDAEALAAAAASGAGITVLSDFLAERGLREGSLVPVLSEWQLPSAPITALTTRSTAALPTVKSILAHLVKRLASSPTLLPGHEGHLASGPTQTARSGRRDATRASRARDRNPSGGGLSEPR